MIADLDRTTIRLLSVSEVCDPHDDCTDFEELSFEPSDRAKFFAVYDSFRTSGALKLELDDRQSPGAALALIEWGQAFGYRIETGENKYLGVYLSNAQRIFVYLHGDRP